MAVYDIPVWGPSKNVPQDDAQYTLNMYPEKVSEGVYTLKARAGNTVVSQFGFAGEGRGQISVGGRHFGIRGVAFAEMVDGVSVTKGALSSNAGICGLVACLPPNGEGQILIVGPDSGEGYVYELATDTFTVLTEADHGFVGGGGQTVFFGGRAWAIKPGTGQFQCSEPYDFLTWPGDAFGTAEFDSDELLSIDTDGNYLLLLGRYTGEMWVFQDTLPLPVRPTNSTFRIGILSAQAHVCFENTFYWFGGNAEGKGVVYALSPGGEPKPISDYSIIRNISTLTGQSSAFMYAYQDLGHRFIFLTISDRTFVYDDTEKEWHEESLRLVPSGVFTCMPWESVIFHDGKLLGLNRTSGEVAEISDSVYTDNGNPIILDRKLPIVPKEASWKSTFNSVELFTEMGNTPVDEDDPNVMLRVSRDRGKTWGTEMWRKQGGNGSYVCRTRWTGLGASFGLVLWFRFVANQYVSFRGVRIDAESGG